MAEGGDEANQRTALLQHRATASDTPTMMVTDREGLRGTDETKSGSESEVQSPKRNLQGCGVLWTSDVSKEVPLKASFVLPTRTTCFCVPSLTSVGRTDGLCGCFQAPDNDNRAPSHSCPLVRSSNARQSGVLEKCAHDSL